MLSDDLANVVERLRLADELDEPMAPESCRLLARVVETCIEDARVLESHPLHVAPPALPPNVIRFPRVFRCVPDGGAA